MRTVRDQTRPGVHPRKRSLVALLTARRTSNRPRRGEIPASCRKEDLMDPAFLLLSLWFLGAAVEFIKGDD